MNESDVVDALTAPANTGAVRRVLGRLFAAVQFMTRIPVPGWTPYGAKDLGASTAFFPFVGLVVGGLAGGAAYALTELLGFAHVVGAVAATATAIGITGFFHEDAFADVCDAFGAYTPERRREVMRDSRVGSFGAAGIAVLLAGEIGVITSMSPIRAFAAIVCAHVIARWSSVVMIRNGRYVTDSASLAKPFADGIAGSAQLFAWLFAAAVTAGLAGFAGIAAMVAVGLLVLSANRFFAAWLGGITGDAVGAVNKFAQLLVLVGLSHPRVAMPWWSS